MNKDEQQITLLEQYYAALAHNANASPPPNLDPASATIARQLRHAALSVKPGAAFRTQLSQQLEYQVTLAKANPIAPSVGRMEPTTMRTPMQSDIKSPFSRPLLRLVSAALALIIIAASVALVSGLLRLGDNQAVTQPASQPTPCNGPLGPWHAIAAYSAPLTTAAVASDGQYLYAVGGATNQPDVASNQLLRYDPATNSWSTLAHAADSFAFADAIYVPANHKLYVFGGAVATGTAVNLTRIYDPATNSWSAGAAMPQPRAEMAAAYWNGKIYLVAGGASISSSNPPDATYPPQSQTWVYDPLANTWDTTRANLPDKVRGAAGAVIDGHLYVAGGLGEAQRTAATYDYDIATNTWTARASLPQPLEAAGSTVVGSRFYVFGGANSAGDALNTAYAYDPSGNNWVSQPLLSQTRSAVYGASIGNTVYAVGGFNNSGLFDSAEAATVSCAGK